MTIEISPTESSLRPLSEVALGYDEVSNSRWVLWFYPVMLGVLFASSSRVDWEWRVALLGLALAVGAGFVASRWAKYVDSLDHLMLGKAEVKATEEGVTIRRKQVTRRYDWRNLKKMDLRVHLSEDWEPELSIAFFTFRRGAVLVYDYEDRLYLCRILHWAAAAKIIVGITYFRRETDEEVYWRVSDDEVVGHNPQLLQGQGWPVVRKGRMSPYYVFKSYKE